MGYIHSYREKENIFIMYGVFRCTWRNFRLIPLADMRLGIVYDPYWIRTV